MNSQNPFHSTTQGLGCSVFFTRSLYALPLSTPRWLCIDVRNRGTFSVCEIRDLCEILRSYLEEYSIRHECLHAYIHEIVNGREVKAKCISVRIYNFLSGQACIIILFSPCYMSGSNFYRYTAGNKLRYAAAVSYFRYLCIDIYVARFIFKN